MDKLNAVCPYCEKIHVVEMSDEISERIATDYWAIESFKCPKTGKAFSINFKVKMMPAIHLKRRTA